MINRDVQHQYRTADLLRIRSETHARYTEVPLDLDLESARVLDLAAGDSLLDVGCGPGVFLRYLRAHGHVGRLAGIDQSAGMIAAAAEATSGAHTTAAANADIEWFTGEADALPFPDAAFTAVSARHMLYHVPDVPAALADFARVVGSGGTVSATTNDPHTTPLIEALEEEALAHFGLAARPSAVAGFNTANAMDLLGSAYPEVQETILTSALVFTTPEPIVQYTESRFGVQHSESQPEVLEEMHDWLMARVTDRLKQMGGVWRDPKAVGLYRCRAA